MASFRIPFADSSPVILPYILLKYKEIRKRNIKNKRTRVKILLSSQFINLKVDNDVFKYLAKSVQLKNVAYDSIAMRYLE